MVPTGRPADEADTEHPASPSWLLPEPLWRQTSLALLLLDISRIVRFASPAAAQLLHRPAQALLNAPFPYPLSLDRTTEIEITNDQEGTVFLELTASRIQWQNQPAFLVSLNDVTASRNKLRQSQRQLDLERALSGFAARFVQTVHFEGAIEETLADISSLTNADRCYLFAFDQEDHLWTLVREWSGQDTAARSASTTDAQPPTYFLPWLTKQLLAGETIHYEDVLDLPQEAEREKNFLIKEGVASWLAMPVYLGPGLVGCIGIENADPPDEWTGFDLNLLWVIAQIMGKALYHRRMERELQAQRAFLQQVIDVNPHLIFAKDREGHHTLVNQAMAEFYGASVESMLGRTDREINPRQDEAVAFRRDDMEVMNLLREKVIPEEPNTNAQGELHYMRTVKRPIIGEDGHATHVLGVATDITDYKYAQDALRASEERYRQLFNSGSDAVFVYHVTPDGLPDKFIEVNDVACQRLGFSKEELLGRTILDINPAPTHQRILSELKQFQMDSSATFERTHVSRQGDLIPVEISARMFKLSGRPAILSIARDIRERMAAEDERALLQSQLQQAQKMEAIGRLTSGIAHDFNNLLTAINGYAEMLLLEMEEDHPSRILAQKIVDGIERAAILVRQLLAFSRKENTGLQTIDLNQILREMEGMFHRIIGEDVQLTLELAEDLGHVSLELTQLEQIVFNLVVNARDAMPSGGRLFIETSTEVLDEAALTGAQNASPGVFVRMRFRDTGTGMNDQVKAHLFEPFFTTKQKDKGTGLGLATIYAIVTQAGGHIMVESRENQGSAFTLYLPKVQVAPSHPDPIPDPTPPAAFSGPETILLVEDDAEVRQMVRHMLEGQGYTVFEAADAETARDTFSQNEDAIHLLLTDVVLPDTHGPILADELRSQKPELKMLFISGYADDMLNQYADLESRAAFVRKPFSPSQLLKTVREVLDA
jgi:two-component system, cell cycle sensor histidine kinase and response regulator CckA